VLDPINIVNRRTTVVMACRRIVKILTELPDRFKQLIQLAAATSAAIKENWHVLVLSFSSIAAMVCLIITPS
jgi:hypothetical protein